MICKTIVFLRRRILTLKKLQQSLEITVSENEYGPLIKKVLCKWYHADKSKPILKITLNLLIDNNHVKEV